MYELIIIYYVDFPSENVRSAAKATLNMSVAMWHWLSACDVLISLIHFNNK